MKLSPINAMMLLTGTVLIYCGITGRNPKDVMVYAFKGQTAPKMTGGTTDPGTGVGAATPVPGTPPVAPPGKAPTNPSNPLPPGQLPIPKTSAYTSPTSGSTQVV